MRTTSYVLAVGATLLASVRASVSEDAYIMEVCEPTNSSGYPDMTAPCNEVAAVELQCIYGPMDGLAAFYAAFGPNTTLADSSDNKDSDDDDDDKKSTSTHKAHNSKRTATTALDSAGPTAQSNVTQRDCICESMFFELILGCIACEKAHGSGNAEAFYGSVYIASLSSEYCVAAKTPTLALPDYLNSFVTNVPASVSAQILAASTSTFSDPLGNDTAVSLYYSQTVSGTSAFLVVEDYVTMTQSTTTQATDTFTSLNTVSGYIVPTVGQALTGATLPASATSVVSSATATTTKSKGAAAAATGRVDAAVIAGVLGFAGVVALL